MAAEEKIPGVQLQGGKGPRRLVALRMNSPVEQFIKRKAKPDGVAYLPKNSTAPSFSEHPKYCRLYVDDAIAVRSVIELSASKYGVPLLVTGDPELCRIILAEAKRMNIAVNIEGAADNTKQAAQAETPKTATKPTVMEPVAAAPLPQHPIPNDSVVRFMPNNKAKPMVEGRVVDSSTGDGISYRYRLAVGEDGSRTTVVYSDDGVFERMGSELKTSVVIATEPSAAYVLPLSAGPTWMMTKEAYLADKERVRVDVGMDKPGYKVDYEYTTPGAIGPYAGVMLIVGAPTLGETVQAPFGEATVLKVSSSSQDISDRELLRAGKLHHRRLVADAMMAGKPVPQEVMAGYPEIPARLKEWAKQQIMSGIPLAPAMYNEMESIRDGSIRVSYNEAADVYDVTHVIDGESYDHVTGVDADGAVLAARNLLGLVSIKEVATVMPEQQAPEPVLVAESLDGMSGNNIEPLPEIDLYGLFMEAVVTDEKESGNGDYLAIVQENLNDYVKQANQRLSAFQPSVIKEVAPDQQHIADALTVREWHDRLGFLGNDPAIVAEKWKGIVTERDSLVDKVAELEAQLKEMAEKNDVHDYELERE